MKVALNTITQTQDTRNLKQLESRCSPDLDTCVHFSFICLMPRYSWNTAKVDVKHQSINEILLKLTFNTNQSIKPYQRCPKAEITTIVDTRVHFSFQFNLFDIHLSAIQKNTSTFVRVSNYPCHKMKVSDLSLENWFYFIFTLHIYYC